MANDTMRRFLLFAVSLSSLGTYSGDRSSPFATAVVVRGAASHGADLELRPVPMMVKQVRELQRDSASMRRIGRSDLAAASARKADFILTKSPFDMMYYCRDEEICPRAEQAQYDKTAHASRVDICFCYNPEDAACYVGSCDKDPYAQGDLPEVVRERGTCQYYRRLEYDVDLDHCEAAVEAHEQTDINSVTMRLAKDKKKKANLKSGKPLKRPPPPVPLSPNYGMSIQETVDLMARNAKQLTEWKQDNAVIEAGNLKKEMMDSIKKIGGGGEASLFAGIP